MFTHSPLNVGMLCGFARMDGDTLLVFHNQYEALAFRLRMAESARRPQFDYEPVAVAFRIVHGANGEPVFEALEVVRAQQGMIPKNGLRRFFRRFGRMDGDDLSIEESFARIDFDPHEPNKYNNALSSVVAAQLVKEAQWSADIRELIDGDGLVADVFHPYSRENFICRWAGFATLIDGRFEYGRVADPASQVYNYVNGQFCIGSERAPDRSVAFSVSSSVRGFGRTKRVTIDKQVLPVTLHAQFLVTAMNPPEPGKIAYLKCIVRELLIPEDEDCDYASVE